MLSITNLTFFYERDLRLRFGCLYQLIKGKLPNPLAGCMDSLNHTYSKFCVSTSKLVQLLLLWQQKSEIIGSICKYKAQVSSPFECHFRALRLDDTTPIKCPSQIIGDWQHQGHKKWPSNFFVFVERESFVKTDANGCRINTQSLFKLFDIDGNCNQHISYLTAKWKTSVGAAVVAGGWCCHSWRSCFIRESVRST